MKYTEREILDALTCIKTICNEHFKSALGCNSCPFSKESEKYECIIHKEFPDTWNIKQEKPFKAFE